MFEKLLPRNFQFFDFFESQAAAITQAARIFHVSVSGDGPNFKQIESIKSLEHKADKIIHECIESLHNSFITPIDREDIHQLIEKMDDIIDYIDAAADCMIIYKIQTTTPEIRSLSKVLLEATEEVEKNVKALRDLKNMPAIHEHCVKIHQMEHEADVIFRNAIGKLFDKEQDLRLLIKLKEIYEILENACDSCEDVANIIEGVMLDYY